MRPRDDSPGGQPVGTEALAARHTCVASGRPTGALSVILSGADGMTPYQHHAARRSGMLKPHAQLCMNCWRARHATVNGAPLGTRGVA